MTRDDATAELISRDQILRERKKMFFPCSKKNLNASSRLSEHPLLVSEGEGMSLFFHLTSRIIVNRIIRLVRGPMPKWVEIGCVFVFVVVWQ